MLFSNVEKSSAKTIAECQKLEITKESDIFKCINDNLSKLNGIVDTSIKGSGTAAISQDQSIRGLSIAGQIGSMTAFDLGFAIGALSTTGVTCKDNTIKINKDDPAKIACLKTQDTVKEPSLRFKLGIFFGQKGGKVVNKTETTGSNSNKPVTETSTPSSSTAKGGIEIQDATYTPKFILKLEDSQTGGYFRLALDSKISDPKRWEPNGMEANFEFNMTKDGFPYEFKSGGKYGEATVKSFKILNGSNIKMIEVDDDSNPLGEDEKINLLVFSEANKQMVKINGAETEIDKNEPDLEVNKKPTGAKLTEWTGMEAYTNEELYPFIYALLVTLKFEVTLDSPEEKPVNATLSIDKNGFNFVSGTEKKSAADIARGTTVDDIPINYTGGTNNVNRFLPKDFRNATFRDEGKLRVFGYSVKLMSPENEKFIKNAERAIKIIEFLKAEIGIDAMIEQKADLLAMKLYDEGNSEDKIIIAKSSPAFGTSAEAVNPTLGDIITDSKYVSPVVNPSNITEPVLDEVLYDLKEHLPEGAVENFVFTFIKFNLLLIQVMSIFFLIYGGYLWTISQGEEGELEKGKNIILWSVIAMVGAAICYALVAIVTQLFTN
jgi:hypothetical protein